MFSYSSVFWVCLCVCVCLALEHFAVKILYSWWVDFVFIVIFFWHVIYSRFIVQFSFINPKKNKLKHSTKLILNRILARGTQWWRGKRCHNESCDQIFILYFLTHIIHIFHFAPSPSLAHSSSSSSSRFLSFSCSSSQFLSLSLRVCVCECVCLFLPAQIKFSLQYYHLLVVNNVNSYKMVNVMM